MASKQGARSTQPRQARAIHAAVVGAPLIARSRSDLVRYDQSIENYRAAELLPS